LALFNPTGEPNEWRRYIELHRLFKRGEVVNFCMERIREEGELDTRELALRIIRHKGLDEADLVLRKSMAMKLIQTLNVNAKRGKLDGRQKRNGVRLWRLPLSSYPGEGSMLILET
jgi:hypothetical protein